MLDKYYIIHRYHGSKLKYLVLFVRIKYYLVNLNSTISILSILLYLNKNINITQ